MYASTSASLGAAVASGAVATSAFTGARFVPTAAAAPGFTGGGGSIVLGPALPAAHAAALQGAAHGAAHGAAAFGSFTGGGGSIHSLAAAAPGAGSVAGHVAGAVSTLPFTGVNVLFLLLTGITAILMGATTLRIARSLRPTRA